MAVCGSWIFCQTKPCTAPFAAKVWFDKIQEPLTQGTNLFRAVGLGYMQVYGLATITVHSIAGKNILYVVAIDKNSWMKLQCTC